MYFKLSFLKNSSLPYIYRTCVALMSSAFPNAINYFIIKNFPGRVIYFN